MSKHVHDDRNRHKLLHDKTLETLYDSIKLGKVELYRDNSDVVRVVHVVHVLLRHKSSGLVLVKSNELHSSGKKRNVNDIMKFVCSKRESTFLVALTGLQSEVGDSLWGQCTQDDKIGTDFTKILAHVVPMGFQLPKTEVHASRSYPGTKVLLYIDTLELVLQFNGVPDYGSFTTVDESKGVVHCWEWKEEECLDEDYFLQIDEVITPQVVHKNRSIVSRMMGQTSPPVLEVMDSKQSKYYFRSIFIRLHYVYTIQSY